MAMSWFIPLSVFHVVWECGGVGVWAWARAFQLHTPQPYPTLFTTGRITESAIVRAAAVPAAAAFKRKPFQQLVNDFLAFGRPTFKYAAAALTAGNTGSPT
jgi:hypothetical protein